ncbi:MAG: META domain-containing protein [Burkholderiaceae bacterium]|nr:META domain-containing protein [Burkholderiaceae bacterium]MEB2318279.1 META domain-containing protein [Pseudomonadota bacterium]
MTLAVSRAAVTAFSLLVLSACTTLVAPAGPAAEPVLEGRRWSLVALQGEALAPNTPLPNVPYVELRDGRLAGRGGCNGIGASYELDGSTLRLGKAVSTMMACAEPTMALEHRFLQVFDQVSSWRGTDGGIEWLDADGHVLASFSESIRAEP